MKSLRIIILVAMLTLGTIGWVSAQAGPQEAGGLVAYYPFNGNADDASGNGNHGQPAGAAILTTDRLGQPDAAYLFDGVSSWITVPGSPSLDSADSAITMAAWVKLDGWSLVGSNFGPVLMKSDSAANSFMYRMYAGPNGLGISIGNWNQTVTAEVDFNWDDWFHIASTWDGSDCRFYVNGQLVAVEPLAAAVPAQDNQPLVIGADTPGLFESFQGAIDEVRIYNQALPGASIAELAEVVAPVEEMPAVQMAITSAIPNPFNPTTSLNFRLGQAGPTRLRIYDVQGRLVRSLLNEIRPAGEHTAVWQGRDDRGRTVSSGVYFARLESAGGVVSRKLLLTK